MMIIDPPVNIFSTRRQIEAWIAELKNMSQEPEVVEALKDAEALLVRHEKLGEN